MPNPMNPISTFLKAYADAVRRKDASAFASLYAADVVVFDAWDNWSQMGADGVRSMAASWFESLGTDTIEVTFSEVLPTLGQDMAVASAFVTYSAVSDEGKLLRSVVNRASFCLHLKEGSWQVAHEHTSVPVGFVSKSALPFGMAQCGA